MGKKRNLNIWLLMSVFLLAMVCATAAGQTIFVDTNATGANNGSSWEDAYKYLQDALDDAVTDDQIWVAQGTYKPDANSTNPDGTGDREATFQLINGVALYGGFPTGGGNWEGRDPNDPNNETVLSGDLNGDDEPIFVNYGENSYHVVTGSGTDANAVLDGFTITNGCASGLGFDGCGGGIACSWRSNPIITNCTISNNSSDSCGGGIACDYYSSPTITNCTISNNFSSGGGGIFCWWQSSPTIINCTISGNSAQHGGGIYCDYECSPTITSCTITGNRAENGEFSEFSDGGGILCVAGSLTITNCTVTGNSAEHGGGAIGSWANDTTISNCILWTNEAPEGSEIYLGYNSNSWVSYTDVQGGQAEVYVEPGSALNWGEGNIEADPCFVGRVNEDYHLLEESPCIDAGDPDYVPEPNETDLDGNPRVFGDRIDMGAYEFIPTIDAIVVIRPETLNLASRGKWITCGIRLGEDYNVGDIDPNSVLLEGEIEAESLRLNEQKQAAMARFSRSDVRDMLVELGWLGEVELTVSGQLADGTAFEGTDVIRVIDKGGRK